LRALHVEACDVSEHATRHQFNPRYMHGLLADAARILCEPLKQVASAKTAAAAVGLPETGFQLLLVTKVSGCSGGDVMPGPGGFLMPEQSITTDDPPGKL
jgi:hypothetical protein